VARARDGDLDAFEVLVARYGPLAYRTAVAFGAAEDAEDVVQDAFVRAFRKLSGFRGDAPFRLWLLRIVVNETKNLHRSRHRREGLALRVRHGPDVVVDPEEEVLAAELREALLAALRDLPDKDRMVLACRYLLDLGEAETAQVLGWPRGSVKSRTSRALARLRDRVAPEPNAEEVRSEPA
jgi:RNA polymerase sigma-70 factor (ECF subfamily)